MEATQTVPQSSATRNPSAYPASFIPSIPLRSGRRSPYCPLCAHGLDQDGRNSEFPLQLSAPQTIWSVMLKKQILDQLEAAIEAVQRDLAGQVTELAARSTTVSLSAEE